MRTEEYNKNVSFAVPGATHDQLCQALSRIPEPVDIVRKRGLFGEGDAQFSFRCLNFKIEADGWEDTLWIITGDGQKHESEMQVLREAVERFEPYGPVRRYIRRVLETKIW